MTDRLLTSREFGAIVGLKPDTILDKWERGELPCRVTSSAARSTEEEQMPSVQRGQVYKLAGGSWAYRYRDEREWTVAEFVDR